MNREWPQTRQRAERATADLLGDISPGIAHRRHRDWHAAAYMQIWMIAGHQNADAFGQRHAPDKSSATRTPSIEVGAIMIFFRPLNMIRQAHGGLKIP